MIYLDKPTILGFSQKKEDLRSLAAGMCALYYGLDIFKVVGASHEENKDVWVKTMKKITNCVCYVLNIIFAIY